MDMNEFLNKFFNETKDELSELLQNKNINQLFELIEKINSTENTKKDLDSMFYSQILYNVMFHFSGMNYTNIVTRRGCQYLSDMIDFLHHVDNFIESEMQLYFLKIQANWVMDAEFYTFSWRFDDDDVRNDICTASITKIERIPVDYEKLFKILNEIIKDENLKNMPGILNSKDYYIFDNEKAFEKYFK